ncbi:MAG: hypothetical protein DSM107014_09865 [Gomphosphaeria aponina SAG 52.96 = DSM 107014]|uniref:Immunity protein Imm6 n=1 Tax=Gomphosphaeria aponina SAG 52.96 = DSM 107014 TaxID=1521640 RepID=A0A941GRI4_9CHRO|nr:hypothetical protein [Gomphosphaeria aponina SAG 52.96 = DSM 107014]
MSVNDLVKHKNDKIKAIFGLTIAEMVVDDLKSDQPGYLLAKEALQLSWEWIEKENVSGDTLSEYVDSDTEKNLGIRELYYDDDNMVSAIIVVTLAIGLVAHYAYESENNNSRPTPIWEIDEESLYDIVKFASNTTFYNTEKADQIIEFLIKNENKLTSEKILALQSKNTKVKVLKP